VAPVVVTTTRRHGGACLAPRSPGRGLERQSDPTAEAALEETVRTAATAANTGSAAAHLQTAWQSLHALHPDPGKAYGEAIKAVEAAAHAIMSPTTGKRP